VLIVEPPLFCTPAAWLVSRLSGGKGWLHVQDFEVDAALDLGIIPFAWMKRAVSAMERWLMRRFYAVSTISNSMLNRLHERGVENPILFPNWADLACMTFEQAGAGTFRKKLNIGESETLCLYAAISPLNRGWKFCLMWRNACPIAALLFAVREPTARHFRPVPKN